MGWKALMALKRECSEKTIEDGPRVGSGSDEIGPSQQPSPV